MYMETLAEIARSTGAFASQASLTDEDFGARLKATRRSLGLSLRDAAQRVGVSATAFQKWENGTIRPRLDNLQALSREFGVGDAPAASPSAKAPAKAEPGAKRASAAQKRGPAEARVFGPTLDFKAQIETSKRAIAAAAGTSPDRVKIIVEF